MEHFVVETDSLEARKNVTCDQGSSLFSSVKECLIQLLDYLSVASPEFGLFSDWQRNKVLRTKPWLVTCVAV